MSGADAEVHRFVLVTGPPASGKSTLAPELAERLDLPLLAKDAVKEVLMGVIGVPDVAASQRLGRAAVETILSLCHQMPAGAVVESNLDRRAAVPRLLELPGTIVEVFCRCPRDEMQRRYRARVGTRHPGHFDEVRRPDDLWNPGTMEPLAAGWPVIEVDTTAPTDLDALATRLLAAFAEPGESRSE